MLNLRLDLHKVKKLGSNLKKCDRFYNFVILNKFYVKKKLCDSLKNIFEYIYSNNYKLIMYDKNILIFF